MHSGAWQLNKELIIDRHSLQPSSLSLLMSVNHRVHMQATACTIQLSEKNSCMQTLKGVLPRASWPCPELGG